MTIKNTFKSKYAYQYKLTGSIDFIEFKKYSCTYKPLRVICLHLWNTLAARSVSASAPKPVSSKRSEFRAQTLPETFYQHRYSRTETGRSLIVFVCSPLHTGKWTMRTGKLKRKKVSLLEKDDWRTVYSNLYDVWLGFSAVSLLLVVLCVPTHAFKVQQFPKSCLGYLPVAMRIFIAKLWYSDDHYGKTPNPFRPQEHALRVFQLLIYICIGLMYHSPVSNMRNNTATPLKYS